jgi:pimeloyl-ACP methyl ester carboxylesterase
MWSHQGVRWAVIIIVLVFFTHWMVTRWAGREIASPARRVLQDYHREFLTDPVAHGVNIEAFALPDGTPCLIVMPSASGKLGARGVRLREDLAKEALKLPPVGQVIGTLVLVHGRRGRKEDYLAIAERFCAVGFRCLILDLPGHGDHPGMVARYGMAEAELPGQVLDFAAERFGFDKQSVGLMGLSMGGSVAVHAAVKEPARWKALVVISSFDALQPVVTQQAVNRFGSWLGGLWADSAGTLYEERSGVALNKIQPGMLAAQLRMPTLIAHGTADRVIPIEAGRRLYALLPATLEKKWVEIPGADHHNVMITDFPVYATVGAWMLRHVAGR